jgi:zinc/manganese transport system permease protein
MIEFLTFMAPPFAACLLLVGIHAYLGIHILEREVIFVDLSLAQVAALGGTIAVLLGHEIYSMTAYGFSLAAALIGAGVFTVTRSGDGRISHEAIIGIVYAVSAAAGILVLDSAPHGAEHIKHLLVGSILWVSWADVGTTSLIYLAVGVIHYVYRQRFLTISFDEQEARRKGWSIRKWDFLFYITFAFVITSSVQIAGVLLVFSFLIVPAVCSKLLSADTGTRLAIGWSIGFAVSAIGCALSYYGDLPTGATIVCVFGVALAVTATAARAVGTR